MKLRFDGIRQLEEDRAQSAAVPEFSQITADLIAHNLLVRYLRICNAANVCIFTDYFSGLGTAVGPLPVCLDISF